MTKNRLKCIFIYFLKHQNKNDSTYVKEQIINCEHFENKFSILSSSVRLKNITKKSKMAAVIPPFWNNPPPDFLGLSGRCSDRPPKNILKVSACFSKCPGFNKNPTNLPVLYI